MKKLLIIVASIIIGAIYAADVSIPLTLHWGLSARQGTRPTMEDVYAAILTLGDKPSDAFFGIFDGHRGSKAAQFSAKVMPQILSKSVNIGIPRIKEVFAKIEQSFLMVGDDSGTTAVASLIEQQDNRYMLYLGWVGDSRAVLVHNDGSIAYATKDHKPDIEEKRINAAGGDIYRYGVWRGPTGLAVSRAIGNRSFKETDKSLIATPDVYEIELNTNHAFLILASDGVWDEINNEEAAQIVRKELAFKLIMPYKEPVGEKLEQSGNSPLVIQAARILRDTAHKKGSTDNISVLIIQFDWHKSTTFKQSSL